jgi:aminomethyltransferase
MIEKGIPRHGYTLCDADGNDIGVVTSGTQSPTLQKAIGMGYVQTKYATPGSEIFVSIRDKKIKASVVKTPFIQQ